MRDYRVEFLMHHDSLPDLPATTIELARCSGWELVHTHRWHIPRTDMSDLEGLVLVFERSANAGVFGALLNACREAKRFVTYEGEDGTDFAAALAHDLDAAILAAENTQRSETFFYGDIAPGVSVTGRGHPRAGTGSPLDPRPKAADVGFLLGCMDPGYIGIVPVTSSGPVPSIAPEPGKRYRVLARGPGRNGAYTWEIDATRIVTLDIPKWRLDGYRTEFRDASEAPADWPWLVLKVIRALD